MARFWEGGCLEAFLKEDDSQKPEEENSLEPAVLTEARGGKSLTGVEVKGANAGSWQRGVGSTRTLLGYDGESERQNRGIWTVPWCDDSDWTLSLDSRNELDYNN